MIVHYKQYHFDFVNMYMWSDFQLRKNHANLEYGKKSYSKVNMNLINFDEIRFIHGTLRIWHSEYKRWTDVFIGPAPTKEISEIYLKWLTETEFEKKFLK